MADYIDREDLLEYCHALIKAEVKSSSLDEWNYGDERIAQTEVIIWFIEHMPSADVVEVVRCKDCQFFEPDTYGDCWCSAKSPGVSKGMCSPSGDSYCSDAERKEA